MQNKRFVACEPLGSADCLARFGWRRLHTLNWPPPTPTAETGGGGAALANRTRRIQASPSIGQSDESRRASAKVHPQEAKTNYSAGRHFHSLTQPASRRRRLIFAGDFSNWRSLLEFPSFSSRVSTYRRVESKHRACGNYERLESSTTTRRTIDWQIDGRRRRRSSL